MRVANDLSPIAIAVVPIWRRQIEHCLTESGATVVDLLVSFFAVADELIKAIASSSDVSQHLSLHLDSVVQEIESLRQQSVSFEGRSPAAHELLHNSVSKVFSGLLALTSASQVLSDLHANVRHNLDQILVALQHEDRMSQILSHVCEDMSRMEQCNTRGEAQYPVPEPEAWLATLKASYTTPEERQVHDGLCPGAAATGVEFF